MPNRIDFLRSENIKIFNDRLESETDPAKRKVLLKLLAEEKAKQRQPPVALS